MTLVWRRSDSVNGSELKDQRTGPRKTPGTYAATTEHKVDRASMKQTFHYSTKKNAAGSFDLVAGKSESKELKIKWSSAKGTSTKMKQVG